MTAAVLLAELRGAGFTLRADEGQLLISPASRLSPAQRETLKVHKQELLAILAWEAAEPPASDETLRVWYQSVNNPPPRRKDITA